MRPRSPLRPPGRGDRRLHRDAVGGEPYRWARRESTCCTCSRTSETPIPGRSRRRSSPRSWPTPSTPAPPTSRFATDAAAATLTVVDDGSGCGGASWPATTTSRPARRPAAQGIGFAGVGIKLGLLVCEEVVTETRRGAATSRRRGTWPRATGRPGGGCRRPGSWPRHGTAVRLRPREPALAPARRGLPRGDAAAALPAAARLRPSTRPGARTIRAASRFDDQRPRGSSRRRGARRRRRRSRSASARKRKPAARRLPGPRPRRRCRRTSAASRSARSARSSSGAGTGWADAATPDRVGGLIEVPALAECLTLNKADFIRVGPAARCTWHTARRSRRRWPPSSRRGATSRTRTTARGAARRARRARPRSRCSGDLADDFPLLARWWSSGPAASVACPWPAGRRLGGERLAPPLEPCMERRRSAEAAAGPGGEPGAPAARRDGPRAPARRLPRTSPRAAGPCRRSRRPAASPARALRPQHPVRGASRRPRAGPPGRVHRVGQRGPSGLPPRGGLALRGLPLAVAVAMALAPLAVDPRRSTASHRVPLGLGRGTGRSRRRRC